MGLTTRLTDAGMRAMNAVHRANLAVSRGRLGWHIGRLEVVELHTIGRSSGRRRSTLLTSPVHDGESYVLVASKGGDDRDPDWYRNLTADPEIELTVGATTARFTARTLSAEEKAALWPRIIAAYPGYAAYQRKTDRDIPVVMCDPVRIR